MSDDKEKWATVWDVTCRRDREGVVGMQMTIVALPDDEQLLHGLALCMRDAGKAFLAERGHHVGNFVDMSPPGERDPTH